MLPSQIRGSHVFTIPPTREIDAFATLLETITPRVSPLSAEKGGGAGESESRARATRTLLIVLDPMTFRRRALQNLLEAQRPEMRVIGHSGPQGLAAIEPARRPPADLLLLNIGSAASADDAVVAEVETVRAVLPETPIVLLGDAETQAQIEGAIRLGVQGYIPASADPAVVMGVLLLVRAGGTYLPAVLPQDAADPSEPCAQSRGPAGAETRRETRRETAPEPAPEQAGAPVRAAEEARSSRGGLSRSFETPLARAVRFTPREREVLHCLGEGLPNKLIAHELALCESTVKVHVRNILKKLNVQSRTQAALFARGAGAKPRSPA